MRAASGGSQPASTASAESGTVASAARSIGPAVFVGDWALTQLWLFIVAPLIGAVPTGVVHRFLFTGAAPVEPEQPAVAAETPCDATSRGTVPGTQQSP